MVAWFMLTFDYVQVSPIILNDIRYLGVCKDDTPSKSCTVKITVGYNKSVSGIDTR